MFVQRAEPGCHDESVTVENMTELTTVSHLLKVCMMCVKQVYVMVIYRNLVAFRRYSQSSCEVLQKMMFFGRRQISGAGEAPPKFLTEIWVTIEHVAKFGDSRPGDLGD